MKFIKDFVLVLFSLVFVVILSACGGGGSSSGGGTDPSFVGTYTGSFTMTFSSPGSGVAPITGTGVTTLVVNPDGTVVIDPGTPEEIRGTISGNTFTATIPGPNLNEPGFTCTGAVNVTGTGTGDTFTGPINGNLVCNGVPMVISGTYTVTKAAAKAPLQNTTLGVELREAVRQAVGE